MAQEDYPLEVVEAAARYDINELYEFFSEEELLEVFSEDELEML